ncbi:MAG: tetratricopeptide repeat protein [Candidatus Accumulibacter sp.]|jgi:Tfp pilus assembly protein PilF|nr:tetratricopeptide repeat protein [Accumulibacter sp.]
MSLLMDAIERAEEARRREAGGETEGASPFTPSAPGSDPRSDLEWRLEEIGVEPFSAKERQAPSMAVPSPATDDADRPVFAVQRRPAAGNALWWIVGAGLLAALGIGAWFWWQLQPFPPGFDRLAAAPASAASAAPPAPPDVHVPSPPSPPSSDDGVALPSAGAAVALAPEAAPPPSSPSPISPVRAGKTVPAALPTVPAVPPESHASAPRRGQPGVDPEFRPTRAAPRVSATLKSAYESLRAGRYQEAQRDYERALEADGKSVDALLGLATLAAFQGRADRAHDYYARALEADPADATAQAGVLGTRGRQDAQADESLLKTALAGRPGSAALHFALGNLYARQQRWSEAQEAYFQAYAAEPDHPDILFNLAVSLDHLRQDRLAAQYYRMALAAGETRAAAFDRNQVTSRLEALQP